MRKIAASVVKILLLSVGLFSLGPQFGSLDIDGDGAPDVPIVVTQCSNGHLAQTTESNPPTRIDLAVESSVPNDPELMHGRIVLYLRRTAPASVNPLRC